MRPIDARTLPDGTVLDGEIVVVGAGAAGITLALELVRLGREVLLVEGGGLDPDPDLQALHEVESTGFAMRPDYLPRLRQLGGTCNLWAGRAMRLLPDDFLARPAVPDGAWPFPYRELEALYPEAERLLGLPGPGAFDADRWLVRASAAERALLASGELRPTVSLWAVRPRRFFRDFRRELVAHPRLRLLIRAQACRLRQDPTGRRVLGVELRVLDGPRLEARGRHVVLACGGLENARLLLLSTDRHPAGIGNEHDLVGRFFMDHPRAVWGRVELRPGVELRLLRGRPVRGGKVQLGLALAPARRAMDGLLHHYATLESERSSYAREQYDLAVQLAKRVLRRGHAGGRFDLRGLFAGRTPDMVYLLTPKEILPHPVYRLLWLVRERIPRRARAERLVLVHFCEQPLDPESRVALSDRHDALGLRMVRLHWRVQPEILASMRALEQSIGVELASTGLGRCFPGEGEPRFTDASHHMGTTRMGSDPRSSVTDAHGRVHGVENLWIAGSSLFPSGGHANPTLTIVALALRQARHLAALCDAPTISTRSTTAVA
ncbi:MAG: GMC family oxidoreductase [Geminicoccaceae bacterium]|nr:GMC family oxidoreductase [Geminicoccaceae bacterium]